MTRQARQAEPVAPVYPPTVVSGHEGGRDMRAVVAIAVAMTREQLVAAFAYEFSSRDADRDPKVLPVEQIRQEVEGYLAAASALELDDAVKEVRRQNATGTAEQVRRLGALARAVDRAYPPLPPVAQLLGSVCDSEVRCAARGCPWRRAGERSDWLLLAAVRHAAAIHGSAR